MHRQGPRRSVGIRDRLGERPQHDRGQVPAVRASMHPPRPVEPALVAPVAEQSAPRSRRSKSNVRAMAGAACAARGDEPTKLTTADGVTLEAELAFPEAPPRCGLVLCHPPAVRRNDALHRDQRAVRRVTAARRRLPSLQLPRRRRQRRRARLRQPRARRRRNRGRRAARTTRTRYAADPDGLVVRRRHVPCRCEDARVDAWMAIAPPVVRCTTSTGWPPIPAQAPRAGPARRVPRPCRGHGLAERWASTDVHVVGGARISSSDAPTGRGACLRLRGPTPPAPRC